MGSLRQEQKEANVADSFILEWKTPRYKEKVLILVEGEGDCIFYYKFFNSKKAEIRYSQGCSKIKEIHTYLLESRTIKHITIKDSDFERLNNTLSTDEGFFYADAHDYEMMCIKNKLTRQEIMENLGIEYSEELYAEIFNELQSISYFKWYNYSQHLNYNFRALNVASLTTEQLNDFDYIHRDLQKKSPGVKQYISEDELKMFKTCHPCCDLYELTCGHDFIKRLCFYLQKNYSKQENEDKLKHIMHPCFRMDAFMQTELYHSIQTWSSNQCLEILRN